ncbi:hypothetical protein L798_12082 [Zootermopsis nevadensis]|uniref:Uncharacterized protein n=1 Tax=Zootermopsis nevadensis TaxID=136037 RepID=A0A067QWU4_ZOONE|nr:hypothetical protein L798_12082 [Zootermopsis nevadensis]
MRVSRPAQFKLKHEWFRKENSLPRLHNKFQPRIDSNRRTWGGGR